MENTRSVKEELAQIADDLESNAMSADGAAKWAYGEAKKNEVRADNLRARAAEFRRLADLA